MWLKKLKNAQEANKLILATAKADNRALNDEEQASFDEGMKTIENCKLQISNEEKVANLDDEFATPVNSSVPVIKNGEPKPIYNSLVSQLTDVRNAAQTGRVSDNLQKLQNVMGMNEGVGSDGGFAIQTDFVGTMLESAVKDSDILKMVDEYTVSGNSNSVSWMDIDESDISQNVFGGIQMYWAAEAQAVAASKPKLKEEKIELEKLMGLAYVTMELDQDSSFVDELLTKGFTTAIRRALVAGIISGDGVGKPTGILNGGGLLTVPKKSGQAADTVVWDNVTSMYHRAIEPRSGGYAWLVHPDVHEQFDSMTIPVGTGGVPVYLPATMTGAVDTLRALPVISSDCCSELGEPGDIILADLNDYFMPVKEQIQKDVSIHVQFLTAENAFRFIFRANGRPKTTTQLTIKNSTKKRARYVALATRG